MDSRDDFWSFVSAEVGDAVNERYGDVGADGLDGIGQAHFKQL